MMKHPTRLSSDVQLLAAILALLFGCPNAFIAPVSSNGRLLHVLKLTSPSEQTMTWVLEDGIFGSGPDPIRAAAEKAGHKLVDWDDEWWPRRGDVDDQRLLRPPRMSAPAIFHGSLENAHKISSAVRNSDDDSNMSIVPAPGAYCSTDAFFCSKWYPRAQKWLLHQKWYATTAAELVKDSERILKEQLLLEDNEEAVFVRPDSPLKPFSGRVVPRHDITLRKLDHGFYYDDENIPVIVAPVRKVGREWRFVIVQGTVATGSGYEADEEGRRDIRMMDDDSTGGSTGAPMMDDEALKLAKEIASELQQPDDVYVLDVCECDGKLYLLELNPFSGADLYGCDGDKVVAAIEAMIAGKSLSG